MTERESLASVRVLVAVAKADGVLHDSERRAIADALEGLRLPGLSLDELLEKPVDLDAELSALTSEEAKRNTFQSAYALAHADGDCSAEERRMLDTMKQRLGLAAESSSVLDRLFKETKETILPSAIQPIADPELRAKEIREDTLKYSILSAVLGAFPVPGLAIATDLVVVTLQVKLARDIGQYYGHTVDREAAKTMLAGLGLGTGARIAVSNLVKFIPGWGSAVGATTSFASTYALGKIVERYFRDHEGKGDISDLRADFKSAQKEGKKAYEESKDAVAAKEEANKAKLSELSTLLKEGKITQAEYEAQAAALA